MDFVSASDDGEYDENTHTVTWTIKNVDPYDTGYVTLTVKVNENAKTTEADETEATVENSATETNSLDIDNEQTTNVVINPLEDDEPEAPTKTLETVNDTTAADATEDDVDSYGNLYVSVGDTVTYSITYYNNLNEVANVIIEDVLDEGVDFVSLIDEDGTTLDGFYYEATHSVKYTAENVAPLTGGTLYLTVTVNENAKSSTNTYMVNQNADSDYSLTYGVEDTTASIANQASTTVVSTTIGNQTTYYSNVVENPLEEDEPEAPAKTETGIDNEATAEPTVTTEGGVDTYTYDTVGLGEEIEYTISYYNYHNTQATIIITDELDSGVTYVENSASDGGVYDAEKHTITWNLTVEPLTEGTVSFEVLVTSDAQSIEEGEVQANVENQATVVFDEDPETENTYKTNTVVNPLDPDEPEKPVKTVSTSSAAGVNGANVNVGDQITYVLTYYNHTNEVADVSIVDALDEGLTYVSSTNGGVYDETTHTVTWAIDDVAPYTGGVVELTVAVNDKALIENVVENDADVTIGDNEYTTNLTTNPVNDEPEDPTKTLYSVTDENGKAQTAKDTEGNTYVSVGDTITYAITYYNNLNEAADVTIVDELDRGVTFVSLTDKNGEVLNATYNAHTITYTVEDVPALTEGTVYLTVTVNEYAKYSVNTYVVSEGYSLTYGVDGDTTASIANQASVTVGNQATSYTNVVENPLEEDEPEDPTKTEATINTESAGEGTETTVNGKDVVEYGEVDVDDSIRYSISYYNYHNTTATITITDELDDGVTFVRASDGGVYDVATHTITWNLTVEPLTSGTVSFRVIVNETAKTIETDETTATVDNEATVVVDDGTTENKYDTNIVTNPIEPDEPEDPEKAVTSETGANNANVNLGDQITYTISYYNHTNSVATVIIEDELDEGVDFVEATDGGAYDEATHTVTWTITNVAPYTDGSVDLTVKVNENASTEEYTVENDAYVTIGTENKTSTNVVTNPVNDEPEAPVKELDSVTYAEEGTTATSDDNDNLYVHVGDTVTYSIDYYNNLNEVATVTIADVLDEGVTFVDATGVEKDDATEDDTITYELTEDGDDTVTVTWTVANVEALYRGTVELTVTVNENAKASENTYDAQGGYELIYDTTASIANQASTTVTSVTVTNQATYYSNVVENPLEEEEPVDPVKTAETVEEEDVEPTVTEDSDGTEIYEYDTVSIGESVTYTISYYNHHNTEATITIVDPLDEGLTYEDGTASDGGVYDETTHTITWTLTVAPLSGGTVSFQAMVNENAKTIETAEETVATVENGATETNSEDAETGHEYKTNIVVHPIDPEDPSEPQKFVSTSSETGVSGDNVSVGDQITYVITYYNHTNTTADVTVVDTLMDGVTFVSATNDGAYDSDTHTVTWTIADVAPYSGGTVNLTIEVTDDALTATQVENDAAVTIGDNEYTTNLVVNPVDDEPQDPVKSVDGGDGAKVSAGDQLTYTITYYNNLGTAADVTIIDELDSDVTYVSSSDGGVYDSDTHTVTWTIEDVDAYTEDSVTLTVKVKSGASGSVTNTASVQIADNDPVDTNEVENPIPTTTTTTSKSSSPKTGDSFQLTLWVLLLAGSAAGLLALYFRRRNSDDAE
ncbi:MAG: DUF11 domain-containing protein [Clostridiales bacterium]|nr:DUF11 domain-containing protein [Clostridiales bacterium]